MEGRAHRDKHRKSCHSPGCRTWFISAARTDTQETVMAAASSIIDEICDRALALAPGMPWLVEPLTPGRGRFQYSLSPGHRRIEAAEDERRRL